MSRVVMDIPSEVLLALKRPFSDGTTHVKFTPEDFIARLAALVPRPRANLTRYHGVFAPAHPWRGQVTGAAGARRVPEARRARATEGRRRHGHGDAAGDGDDREEPHDAGSAPKAPLTWAERLRRVFGIDITVCPHCGGRLRVTADVTDPEVIERILEHVRREGLPRAPPARTMPVSDSRNTRSRSIQPLAAAASIMANSPDT